MAKILHAGDVHMDSAFAGLTGEQAAQRRAGQRELLQKIVEIGNRENVEILLLSGDLLDGLNAYYETALCLGEILSRSRAHVFIAPGNHDAYHSMSPYRSIRFPENVHLFTSAQVESVDIPELNVCVHGAAFTSNECEISLLRNFRAPDDGRVHIMVLHGEVTEGYSKYNPLREEDIEQSNLNYLALGHVHSFDGVNCVGKTDYAYCGCPEGRGFDELGDKGVLLGEVTTDGAKIEFQKISEYSYNIINLRITPDDDVLAKVGESLPQADKNGLYRVIMTGECERIDTDGIREAFMSRVYYLEIIDRTVPVRSVWQGEDEDSLKGVFLRRLHKRYLETGDTVEQEIIRRAARFGAAALDNGEEPR